MKRRTIVSCVTVTLLAGLAAGCNKSGRPGAGSGGATAAAGGTPSISDIMQQVNRRKSGLHSEVGEALQAEPVDWATIEPKTKNYAALADFLGKNDPPKGDKASWESLTKAYAADAQTLHAAAEKKDKDAALAAHQKLNDSCMGCHRSHREMRGKGR
jgi:cytochrome c556